MRYRLIDTVVKVVEVEADSEEEAIELYNLDHTEWELVSEDGWIEVNR